MKFISKFKYWAKNNHKVWFLSKKSFSFFSLLVFFDIEMSASIEIKRVSLSSSADLFTKKSEKETNGTSGKRKATKSTRIQLKLDEPTFDNFPEFDFNKLIYIEKVRLTIFFQPNSKMNREKKLCAGGLYISCERKFSIVFAIFVGFFEVFPNFQLSYAKFSGKLFAATYGCLSLWSFLLVVVNEHKNPNNHVRKIYSGFPEGIFCWWIHAIFQK